jgi:tRNA-2-methylthio-N6-dimethylallyladenosine synthase
MNRKHTRDFYLEIIEKFKAARPDMAFSSDFIVGYPGETEEDFAQTLDIVERVGYSQCYSFKYSPRPGTPASMLTNQVPEKVKDERLQRLQNLIREKQTAFNASKIGEVLYVLFDKKGKNPGQLQGKSEYLQAVVIEADDSYLNKILPVEITSIETNSLKGRLIVKN